MSVGHQPAYRDQVPRFHTAGASISVGLRPRGIILMSAPADPLRLTYFASTSPGRSSGNRSTALGEHPALSTGSPASSTSTIVLSDWSYAGSAAILCESPAVLVLMGLEPSRDSSLSDVTLDTTQVLLDNVFIMARNSRISGAFTEVLVLHLWGILCQILRHKRRRRGARKVVRSCRNQRRIPRCVIPILESAHQRDHVTCFTTPVCRRLDTCLCHYLSCHGIYSSIQSPVSV